MVERMIKGFRFQKEQGAINRLIMVKEGLRRNRGL